MFEGQVDPSHQVHDLNPGITPDGLFWTTPIPRESVQVDLQRGTATMRMTQVPMRDQQNITNALNHGPSIPATVSFAVRWRGAGRRRQVRKAQHRFAAQIVANRSTIEWQFEAGDHRVTSDPASTSKNVYSLLGRERNGVFFR